MLLSLIRSGANLAEIIACVLSSLAVIFLTLPIHEFAHAFVATKLGDPTPRYQGRLTINPFAHIDYIGAASIILFGFGWAKPVQINARYFKNPKQGMALSALAGPLANIVLSFISALICNCILFFLVPLGSGTFYGFYRILYYLFNYVAMINVYLAVFNLLPIPPLDGSRILFVILPQRYYFKIMQYERYIYIAIIVLLFTGVLSAPLNYISNFVLRFVYYLAGLPFNLFKGSFLWKI